MSKMSKIDHIKMGCNAMYVEDGKDDKNLQYTQHLKSSKSQLSKTFFRLKIHWILRKLWAKNMFVYYWDTSHQTLCILKHVQDVEDRSSKPMGCNPLYVKDVKDCKKSSICTGCYSCLMSEMSEMWNISIKDQRQHCTEQCCSCWRCRRDLTTMK